MDGGKEYSPNRLADLAEDLGQIVELTTPYNPEQDGVSERSIGIICARTRSAMIDMDIPPFLWPLIFESIVLITNRTATTHLEGKTPFEALTDEFYPDDDNRPSVAHLRVLGCKTYVQIPKEKRVTSEKVKARAEVGILVGYEGNHIFKVYIPTRSGPPESKIVRSSNVRFDEGGLITKPLPYKNDTENDSTPAGATGEESGNQDQQSSDLLPSQTPTAVEVDSDDPVTDMDSDHEDQEEVETELLPEITQIDQSEDELPPPKRRQHKVHIPNPEFDRRTRQTTRRQAESSSSQNPNPNILNTALFLHSRQAQPRPYTTIPKQSRKQSSDQTGWSGRRQFRRNTED